MTLEQLNYLIVLQEERNMSRAAERLYITQPTLTAYVSRLEKKLGFMLFDRRHSPVVTTPSGKKYIEKMKEIVYAELQLEEALRKPQEGGGHVTIGIGYGHSLIQCPDLIERLLEKYPELDISIEEGQENHLLTKLSKGEIDIFFGHAELEAAHMRIGVVHEERNLLLVPIRFLQGTAYEGHLSSGRSPIQINPSVLQNKPVIMPGRGQGSYITLMSILSPCKIVPQKIISTNNNMTGARMAAKGLGYCYGNGDLTSMLQPKDRKMLAYCYLPHMRKTRNFYYSFSEDHPQAELLMEIVEILRSI